MNSSHHQSHHPHHAHHSEPQSLFSRVGHYFTKDFSHDLISGIVVALVALPLCIAFAIASGVKPEQGLYTGIIAGGLIAVFSGSRYQVAGPTGAFVVILLGVVNKFGIEGLLISGFLAGVMLLLMGIFRFGTIIKFIPYPVTVGFTAGIGVIIFSGQIQNLLGLAFDSRPNGFVETISAVSESVGKGINVTSLIIGLSTFAGFFLWARLNKKIPPMPIALLVGIFVGLLFPEGVKTVGDIPSSLPSFQLLPISFHQIDLLLPSAFTIAMLGAIESLLSAVVADGMTGTKHNSNKELIAQGIGNMVVPFFGGIPATGAIARTATNIRNGAKTKVSAFIHAIVLFLLMFFFAPYGKYIPLASLGALLMIVAYSMSDIPHFLKLFRAPLPDIAVLLTTFLMTVFLDLTVAVATGIVLSAILLIKRLSEIHVATLEENVEGHGSHGSKKLHESIRAYPEILLYEIAGPMFFGATSMLLDRIVADRDKILILRMKHVHFIDATALHALEVIIERVHENGGKIVLATVEKNVHDVLVKDGLIDKMGGADYVCPSSTNAIEFAKKLLGERRKRKK